MNTYTNNEKSNESKDTNKQGQSGQKQNKDEESTRRDYSQSGSKKSS